MNMKPTQTRVIATIAICMGLTFTGLAQTCDLNVTVKGVKSQKGNILIGIGDPQNPTAMKGDMVKVSGEIATTQMKAIKPGQYTLYIFHDENENYQLDKDEKDIPLEGCIIKTATIDEKTNAIEVTLQYPKRK